MAFIRKVVNELKKSGRRGLVGALFGTILFFIILGNGVLRQDTTSFLAGEGMWLEKLESPDLTYRQEFRPGTSHVKSVGFYVDHNEGQIEGSILFQIADNSGNSLFETELSGEEIEFGGYTDVEVNLVLEKGESYFINLTPKQETAGLMLGVCGREQHLKENGILLFGADREDMQILARYRYRDVLTPACVGKLLLLILLMIAGMCVGGTGVFAETKNKTIRRFFEVALLVLLPLVVGRQLELVTIDAGGMLPHAMAYNLAIMYLFEAILLLFTWSPMMVVLVTDVVLCMLYSANFFVYQFRGAPLCYGDMKAWRTAARVVGNYHYRPDGPLTLAWCSALLFLVWALCLWKRERVRAGKRLKEWVARGLCKALAIALTVASGYVLLYTDFLTDRGFANYQGFEKYITYRFDGYLVATCLDIKDSRISPPEGYSKEAAEKILEKYGNASEEEKGMGEQDINAGTRDLPHVILIMNESLSDLRVLGNLQLNQENLGFMNSLSENTIRGYVRASVLGGGTANSEFEVFTGCSMGLLPTSYYPYQQGITESKPSLISAMKEAGYTTYSMHPEKASNWNRERIYQYLGFDYSLWDKDFEGASKIHAGVSDEETYRKIETLYEQRKAGEKLFIFDLTMQNHGGYGEPDVEQDVKALNVSCDEADTYLSLMKISDQALEKLISYFAKEEEKVLICVYGDHQPEFADAGFYEEICRQTPGLSETEKLQNRYKVPFFIWANYEMEGRDDYDISMNYLGGLLLRTAGIPLSPYFAYLEELRESYPIITINGYEDSMGNSYSINEAEEAFGDYRMLQYYYLYDDN